MVFSCDDKWSAGEAIAGGEVVIDVKYFGIHVHRETHRFCEETRCPVSQGDFLVSHDEVLPAFAPPVRFLSPFLEHSLEISVCSSSAIMNLENESERRPWKRA